MVAVEEGELLNWNEIKNVLEAFKEKALQEFVAIYNRFKDIKDDPFKWGDEIEFCLVKFDHQNKKAQLLLKADPFFKHINEYKANNPNDDRLKQVDFHYEYTSYMIETIPGEPLNDDINAFSRIEDNMRLRRQIVQEFLDKDEYIMSLTSFPLLGCKNFTLPYYQPNIRDSLFYSDKVLIDLELLRSANRNKRERKGSNMVIYAPIYVDKNTPQPFLEDLSVYNVNNNNETNDDSTASSASSASNNQLNELFSKPNQIYMDHDGFGMGCCCIQVTFQASSLENACYMYDQLTPLTPIVIALSASSPIWRGYLSDIDCRWNILKQAMDDRTREELGLEPLKNDRFVIKKSRFDTTDVYLSQAGEKYNDYDFERDEFTYETLISQNVEPSVARHLSSIFIRDPIFLYKENLKNYDQDFSANFDLFNCSNWRLLRFKPPPMKSEQSNKIGWRIEFRPTELQFTDFDNAAFATFIILATRAITALNLNFLIDITKVDGNMQRAQHRNACREEKFYFRQNVNDSAEKEANLVEMSMNEIINGSDRFRGLVPLIKDYLNTISATLTEQTKTKIDKYLKLIELRASGHLLTPASWIRKFVSEHPKYQHDSRINEEINYDLIWNIYQISAGKIQCPDLLP